MKNNMQLNEAKEILKKNGYSLKENFEEVYTSDSEKARKLYINAVVNELIHKVDTTFYRTKCNCANEIIAKFSKEMQERWGDNG